MTNLLLSIVLAPLIAAAIAGLFGKQVGRSGAHWITILSVAFSFVASLYVLYQMVYQGHAVVNENIYTWLFSDGIQINVGFLVDNLTAMMMVVVTFVSLMVHIYTIGYMHEDPGYQRFFSYISLFTFSMLMLVMANNFIQLFFGWEAVGLVSYLLIGFWFKRPTAIHANMKAFLVNRVGDFGFLLGIAAVLYFTGSLDYATVFSKTEALSGQTISIFGNAVWAAPTVVCILLFIGAMGKSAQVPLHVWLPDSMEGPTPISALIHAATMVTAGIFMVARMSPMFELSTTALSFVLIIGSITALFMGLLGIVQNDIKRVVAYSTISQLGYMTVALGASAYSAAVFHLMTHAFFKALLFLAAGSVIIGMHHEQDMRKMGGLKKYMPITYWTTLIGSLALIGTPFFSGFYSKDAIIEAVHASATPGHAFANFAVLAGVFITAFYTFRMFFMVFHGEERFDEETRSHLHESPKVVTIPLILLAIPSLLIGFFTIQPMLFGNFFDGAIYVSEARDVLAEVGSHFHGPVAFALHSVQTLPFWLIVSAVASAWYIYLKDITIAEKAEKIFALPKKLFDNKYYLDDFNEKVLARGARGLGQFFWKAGDETLIDGAIVNGSAKSVGFISSIVRKVQSGYLYHYAFAMVIGLALLLAWYIYPYAFAS